MANSSSFASFATRMNRAADRLPRVVSTVQKAVAESIDREVVINTPVDIGTARSNWVVSVGTAFDTTINAYSPGRRLGRSEKANAFAALIQGRLEIASALPGQTIYITNNVDYIRLLNQGHSRQAPPLFVQQAVKQGILLLNGVDLKLL